MPNGVINPKGRINLNETTRDISRQYYVLNDEKLGYNNPWKSEIKYKKPFAGIKSTKDTKAILTEIRRLAWQVKKKKSAIHDLLRETFGYTKLEAEFIYFKALTNDRIRGRKKINKRKK
jgi:hypothetical protein